MRIRSIHLTKKINQSVTNSTRSSVYHSNSSHTDIHKKEDTEENLSPQQSYKNSDMFKNSGKIASESHALPNINSSYAMGGSIQSYKNTIGSSYAKNESPLSENHNSNPFQRVHSSNKSPESNKYFRPSPMTSSFDNSQFSASKKPLNEHTPNQQNIVSQMISINSELQTDAQSSIKPNTNSTGSKNFNTLGAENSSHHFLGFNSKGQSDLPSFGGGQHDFSSK